MQEQEEEKKKIPIPQIMLILLQQLNYTAHEKEAILQCEEKGSGRRGRKRKRSAGSVQIPPVPKGGSGAQRGSLKN